jgi:putative transposase
MSRYRRDTTLGATWFFTVVTYRRQPVLCDDAVRTAFRDAITTTRTDWPFRIDAWVLLPDHLHCIWTLPEGDADFSTRWNLIKRRTSKALNETYMQPEWMSKSKRSHRELTFWQRRFWEHRIRDDLDFERHTDYIHYNPVKHGQVTSPLEWKHSTFHRFVKESVYAADWGSNEVISFADSIGSE